MKRILNLTIVTIVLLACTTFAGAAYASENVSPAVKVWVDNNDIQFDAKLFIDENNRTLIPVRFVSEALGAKVEWNQDKQEVTIKDNDTIINLSIGSNDIFINGEAEKMDTKAIIKEDRTFVPLRFVSEALNCNVTWDQEFYIAKINRDTEVEETDMATIISKRFSEKIKRLVPYEDGGIIYKDDYCKFSVHRNNGEINNYEIFYFPKGTQIEIANEMLMYVLEYLYPMDYKTVYADAINFASIKEEYTFKDKTYKDRHTFFNNSSGNYGVLIMAYEKGYVYLSLIHI